MENGKLIVYPNPTGKELKIISSDFPISNIYIYDITGKLLLMENLKSEIEITINVLHLPVGVYYLKADNKTVKFVKE
jgi:hypothetical protein